MDGEFFLQLRVGLGGLELKTKLGEVISLLTIEHAQVAIPFGGVEKGAVDGLVPDFGLYFGDGLE